MTVGLSGHVLDGLAVERCDVQCLCLLEMCCIRSFVIRSFCLITATRVVSLNHVSALDDARGLIFGLLSHNHYGLILLQLYKSTNSPICLRQLSSASSKRSRRCRDRFSYLGLGMQRCMACYPALRTQLLKLQSCFARGRKLLR